jgi:threonine aldolase
MPETPEQQERRFELMRACSRQLFGERRPTMREALAAAAEAPLDLDACGDRYGDGAPVAMLEERVAALLGKPAAVLFPTGVMAQQVALRIWAARTGDSTVALHPMSHLDRHEDHAYSRLAGLRAAWPTTQPRPITADEVRAVPEPFGTLAVELPLREAGFLLPSWDELVEVVQAARERGARVHFDGARLWESAPHLSQDLSTIAALADTVYVSLYKSLGALFGAVLAGDADVVAEARVWRHRYGGMLSQLWPAAVTGLAGLRDELPRLPSYVEHARVVAAALAEVPGARVYPSPPHTHEFQLWLPGDAESLKRAALELAEEEKTWFAYHFFDHEPSGYAHTEMRIAAPALVWTAEDVRAAAESLLARARR